MLACNQPLLSRYMPCLIHLHLRIDRMAQLEGRRCKRQSHGALRTCILSHLSSFHHILFGLLHCHIVHHHFYPSLQFIHQTLLLFRHRLHYQMLNQEHRLPRVVNHCPLDRLRFDYCFACFTKVVICQIFQSVYFL